MLRWESKKTPKMHVATPPGKKIHWYQVKLSSSAVVRSRVSRVLESRTKRKTRARRCQRRLLPYPPSSSSRASRLTCRPTLEEDRTPNDAGHDEEYLECRHDVEGVEELEPGCEPVRLHHDGKHHHEDDEPRDGLVELVVTLERLLEEFCRALGKEAGLTVEVRVGVELSR